MVVVWVFWWLILTKHKWVVIDSHVYVESRWSVICSTFNSATNQWDYLGIILVKKGIQKSMASIENVNKKKFVFPGKQKQPPRLILKSTKVSQCSNTMLKSMTYVKRWRLIGIVIVIVSMVIITMIGKQKWGSENRTWYTIKC